MVTLFFFLSQQNSHDMFLLSPLHGLEALHQQTVSRCCCH